MKPFNLELAKKGHPVRTKDGRKARIICFDRKGDDFPICALVDNDGAEWYRTYTLEGRFSLDFESECDLFMVSEKKEGWINIYKNQTGTHIFDSKEAAFVNRSEGHIDTIKIEWEE